jgi:hypothetical protein
VCKQKRREAGKRSFFGRSSEIEIIVIDKDGVKDMHSGDEGEQSQ